MFLLQIVPITTLSVLRWSELETMVCGNRTIDVDMLARHTVYPVGTDATSQHIKFFWAAMKRLTQVLPPSCVIGVVVHCW